MEKLKIRVNQLIEGSILVDDVLSATNKPLILRNTVVTNHIIAVLNAFLIDEVEIQDPPVNGQEVQVEGEEKIHIDRKEMGVKVEQSFYKQYISAVNSYKQLYIGWQSGSQMDISKVRHIILPLVEELLTNNLEETFKLYHYSTKEDYLFHHSVSVALLSAFLAKKLGYKQGDINQISITGLLCDSGMAKVDAGITAKNITLTEKEYRGIKQHPIYSYQLLKNVMSIKEGVKIGVLQHHERIDGSGYPLGVKGAQLHPYSKIVALADTYQAMVSVRPYRSKQSPFKVLEQIIQDDFGRFDLSIVTELKKGLLKFSAGTKVRLSNGLSAEIVFIDEQYPTRPMIKILGKDEIITLKDRRELYIEELI